MSHLHLKGVPSSKRQYDALGRLVNGQSADLQRTVTTCFATICHARLVSGGCLVKTDCDSSTTRCWARQDERARTQSGGFERPTQGRRSRLMARCSGVRSVHQDDCVAGLDGLYGARGERDDPVIGI